RHQPAPPTRQPHRIPRAAKADRTVLAAALPYRRCAAAMVAEAAAAKVVSAVNANCASMINVLPLTSPSAERMSHRPRDQISPSACTSPTTSAGYTLVPSIRRRQCGTVVVYDVESQSATHGSGVFVGTPADQLVTATAR